MQVQKRFVLYVADGEDLDLDMGLLKRAQQLQNEDEKPKLTDTAEIKALKLKLKRENLVRASHKIGLPSTILRLGLNPCDGPGLDDSRPASKHSQVRYQNY